MSLSRKCKKKLLIALAALLVLGGFGAWFTWFTWLKFFREEPEQAFANETERFMYGSIGAEANRGLVTAKERQHGTRTYFQPDPEVFEDLAELLRDIVGRARESLCDTPDLIENTLR